MRKAKETKKGLKDEGGVGGKPPNRDTDQGNQTQHAGRKIPFLLKFPQKSKSTHRWRKKVHFIALSFWVPHNCHQEAPPISRYKPNAWCSGSL